MSTIISKIVWEKISQDQLFLGKAEPVRELTKRIVEAIPTIFGELLNTTVTVETLLKTKIIYVRHFADYDFIVAMMFKSEIAMLEQLADTFGKLVESGVVSDEEIMLGQAIGLNDEARSRYLAKNLTISDLLMIQPMLIFSNNK